MDVKEFVLSHVDYVAYYQSKFPKWDGNHNTNVKCPFHPDGTASLSLNINEKGGAFCHGCNAKAGSIVHFEKMLAVGKLTDEEAGLEIYKQFIPIISSDTVSTVASVRRKVETLLKYPRVHDTLLNDLRISKETVESFELGYDATSKRITIPVYDHFGNLVNYRRYLLPSMRDAKSPKMLNTKGYGSPPHLYPLKHLNLLLDSKSPPAMLPLMAGERDCLLAWSMGIPCVTATTGEKTWLPTWTQYLKDSGCTIYIVQDNDDEGTGEAAAKKKQAIFKDAGIKSYIVSPTGYKDFSEWVIEEGATTDDFLNLCALARKKAESYEDFEYDFDGDDEEDGGQEIRPFPGIIDPGETESEELYNVSDIRSRPDLLNTKIKVHAIVSGRVDRTYSVPYVFRIGGELYQLPYCRELVQMIRTTDDSIIKYIKKKFGTNHVVKPVAYTTITEIEIIPVIIPGQDTPYVNQRCFYFGRAIDANIPYEMKIIPTTLMTTQETVGLVCHVAPISNVLDNFILTDEVRLELAKYFKRESRSPVGVLADLQNLCERVATRCTKVTNRNEWHAVALLTWMSPLKFNFGPEGEQRGWLNSLALGDTETGKSKVCHSLKTLLGCGTFINSENCTYVGLVGGAVKNGAGQFMLRWGKIPLYNRQLVVVEELSGLTTTEISHMSEVRSSGVARLDKGGLSGETSAQTRLLFLSNVREAGSSLSTAPSGVHALQSLVGHNEDIARFDLICTLVDSEVSNAQINRNQLREKLPDLQEDEVEALRNLIKFIWALKPNQIEITSEAYQMCLDVTLEFSKQYHPSIPIFKAGSGRMKIARIACAIACAQFAWNKEKKKIVVEPRHVGAARLLMQKLYDKPSLGYARYSRQKFFVETIRDTDRLEGAITQSLRKDEQRKQLYRIMAHSITFSKQDLADYLGIPVLFSERLLHAMIFCNVATKSMTGYSQFELTPQGRKWMNERNDEQQQQ